MALQVQMNYKHRRKGIDVIEPGLYVYKKTVQCCKRGTCKSSFPLPLCSPPLKLNNFHIQKRYTM